MLSITYSTSSKSVKVDRSSTARLSISGLSAVEDDEFLTNKLVSMTVDWGDGSTVEEYGPESGSISIAQIYHSYRVGVYTVQLTAVNYKEPEPDTVREVFVFTVSNSTSASPAAVIGTVVGPILPRDSGFPNRQQWSFNIGSDIEVLESSVRMLLLTVKGERLMLPDYGTNLQSVLFDPAVGPVESIVVQEILSAVAAWEPRIQVDPQSIVIERSRDGRAIKMKISFVSKLSGKPFSTVIDYTN